MLFRRGDSQLPRSSGARMHELRPQRAIPHLFWKKTRIQTLPEPVVVGAPVVFAVALESCLPWIPEAQLRRRGL